MARTRAGARRRIGFEGLESRELLATLYVATTGSDGGSGGADSPLHSIQAAVTKAVSGDEIRVAAGTYTYDPSADHFGPKGQFSYSTTNGTTAVVAILGKNLRILGGYSTSNWAVADPVNNPTIIDGQGTNRGIFVVPTDASSLDLEGFTVQNCLAQGIAKRGGTEAVYAFGGAVFADMGGRQGDPDPWVFRNDVFKNNKAVASGTLGDAGGRAAGGAIELRYVVNTTLDNVVFDGNQAIGANGSASGGGGLGGAIHLDHSTLTGTNVTFTNNKAMAGSAPGGSGKAADGESADALGGALSAQGNSQVTLSNVTATSNTALGGDATGQGGSGFGGAFYGEGDTVNLRVSDSFFQGNTAQGGNGSQGGLAGGGAFETHEAALVLDRSQIVANVARGGGSAGAIGSANGGGLFLTRFSGAATTTITNSVIADNSTASGAGGGGGISLQGVTANLSHLTLDNNHLGSQMAVGQGLLLLAGPIANVVNLANSIVSNHSGANGGAIDVAQNGGQLTVARLLFAGNGVLTTTGFAGRDTVISSALTALYNAPGSPHWDYHLSSKIANPAVDASVGSTATVDLDGNARDAKPDLGAYELTTGRVEFVTPIQVSEGGKAQIVIARRGDLSQAVTVTLAIVAGGSAQSGTDFTPFGNNGTIDVTFNPYEQTKTVELPTADNSAMNDARTVNVALSVPAASAGLIRLGDPKTATVSILDNDSIPASPGGVSGFAATNLQIVRSTKGIVGAVLQFDAPLNAKAAKKAKAYLLRRLGGKGKFPKVARVVYRAGSSAVTIRFSGPIRAGSSGQLILNAARLPDASGRHLAGDTAFTLTA